MGKHTKQEIQESADILRAIVKPEAQVFAIIRARSRSGMSRTIDFLVFIDGCPRYLSYHMGVVLGLTHDRKKDGLRVTGCGMDMAFHTLYNLAHVIYPGNKSAEDFAQKYRVL